ncbi:lysostaphin resistance A-like protein [Lysobacter tyrosinilyticus]
MQKTSLHELLRLFGFLLLAALAMAGSGVVSGTVFAMLAITPDRPLAAWMFPAIATGLLLLVTWVALHVEKLGFAALGLACTRRRAWEFAIGLAMGTLAFGLLTMLSAWWVGAHWQVDWASGARVVVQGLPLALLMLLPEELVFRGYAFRKLQTLCGARVALVLSSLLFGAYHLLGSGDWAMGAVFRFAMPALGGLVFGYALLRTGGLAMPIGLHLGGNWIQGSLFGLGAEPGSTLWAAPLDAEQVRALAAPDLMPHLPYLLAMLLLGAFVMMWRPQPAPAAVR